MNVFDYFFADSKEKEKDFILGPKETISYKALYKNSLILSKYLKDAFGENNSIVLISPNSVFFVTAYLAIMKSGNACVPVNPDIEPGNLDFIINVCNTKYVFITSELQNRFDLKKFTLFNEEKLNNILNSAEEFIEADINDNDFSKERR